MPQSKQEQLEKKLSPHVRSGYRTTQGLIVAGVVLIEHEDQWWTAKRIRLEANSHGHPVTYVLTY